MISLPDNELQMRLRHLPGVDTVLAWAEIAPLVMEYGHDTVVTAIRKVISAERDAIRAQPGYVTDQSYIAAQIVIAVAALNAPTLSRLSTPPASSSTPIWAVRRSAMPPRVLSPGGAGLCDAGV